MAEVKVKGVDERALVLFDAYCKKMKRSRNEMLKSFIANAGKFELVIDTELRMKAILDEVIEHLDLNTKAYLMNVSQGYLPFIDELKKEGAADETIHDSAERTDRKNTRRHSE